MATPNIKVNNRDDPYELYRTEPKATELAYDNGVFKGVKSVYDPCDGLGGITNILEDKGITCYRADVVNRNGPLMQRQRDFLTDPWLPCADALVMNPPFTKTSEFLDTACSFYNKVIMFNRISFLETVKRATKIKSNEWPLSKVWIHAGRVGCAKGFDDKYVNAVMYAWFVFDRYHKGEPVIDWLLEKSDEDSSS